VSAREHALTQILRHALDWCDSHPEAAARRFARSVRETLDATPTPEDVPGPRPRLRTSERRTESYATQLEASARVRQLRQAGYHGQSVDMGLRILVHIDPGKHGDLARLPQPERTPSTGGGAR
jgi:hypothetical protein